MQTFLDQVSAHVIEQYADRMDELCIVLPNRRAGLFLKSALVRHAGKSIWSPGIFSIEDFITKLSGLQVIEPVYLQLELYEVHREIEGKNAQPLSEFLKWGQVLLSDFNDIDMYRIDAGQLFSNLNDEKAMALWNLDQKPLTEFEINYLHFYNSLAQYYDKLTARLLAKHQVYQGLAYKYAADHIETIANDLPWIKILFTGFNALTTCEEYIFTFLEKSGKAELLWDTDSYYMNDTMQEAGHFLRKYAKKFNNKGFDKVSDHFGSSKKKIEVIGVAKNTGQVKMTGQLLKQFSDNDVDLTKTAVVLNDESLILPLLNSIPEEIKEFNLTMGLPLQDTPLFRLIRSLFDLQLNSLKFDRTGSKKGRLYFRDILNVLEHPYVNQVLGYNVCSTAIEAIKTSNKIFFTYDGLISDIFSAQTAEVEFAGILFEPWKDNATIAVQKLTALIQILKTAFEQTKPDEKETVDQKNKLDMEYLFSFSKVIKKLNSITDELSVYRKCKYNL